MSLLIIKLGGSVITYKQSLLLQSKNSDIPKARTKNIKRLAKEILSLYKKGYKIILVHGGGSFGHNLAKKYNLSKGLKFEKSLIGLSKTVQSMNKLNYIIVDILEKTGLPTVSFPPHSFIIQNKGILEDFDTSTINKVVELGFIPVLYGDVVTDEKLGCSIISGDTITTYLGKKLNAKKVIFLTDVDGIFDSNPKINPNAKLIQKITNKNINRVLESLTPHNLHDVTGEMRGKILSIYKNLNKNTSVVIANGLNPKTLLESLGHRHNPIGTKLDLD